MSNFTDSRDNTTAIETAIIAADAHADTRDGVATMAVCDCEMCRSRRGWRGKHDRDDGGYGGGC